MARTAITAPNPVKLKLSSGISPVNMSQAANNNIPIFVVNFIADSLNGAEEIPTFHTDGA